MPRKQIENTIPVLAVSDLERRGAERLGAATVQEHCARVSWMRGGAKFVDQRYSRVHDWHFDGGARIQASASPGNVPAPYATPAAVDPEEALIAAAASCHMLWFLSLAATQGFVVDSYIDEASGVIEPDPAGKLAFSRITLSPKIAFSGSRLPDKPELDALHREANERCFVANSLRCSVVVAADENLAEATAGAARD